MGVIFSETKIGTPPEDQTNTLKECQECKGTFWINASLTAEEPAQTQGQVSSADETRTRGS